MTQNAMYFNPKLIALWAKLHAKKGDIAMRFNSYRKSVKILEVDWRYVNDLLISVLIVSHSS